MRFCRILLPLCGRRCHRRIIYVLSVPNIIDSSGGGDDGVVSNPLLTSCILVLTSSTLPRARGAMYRHRLCCVDGGFAAGYYTPTHRLQERAAFVLQNIFGPRSRDATRHVTTSDENCSSPASNPHSHYACTNTHT